MTGAITGAAKSTGFLTKAWKFFFGSKLRTAVTLGTGALMASNRGYGMGGMGMGMGMGGYGSYAMGSPAMMHLGMHRGMYPGFY